MNRNAYLSPAMATAYMPPPADRLLALPLFEGMGPTALARIAAGAHDVVAVSGTVIFRRGDPCRGLYIVDSGQVKLALQTPQGDEKVVEVVGPGGIFGETALFLDRPHMLVAESLTNTRVVFVAKATVLEELDHTSGFTRAMIANLSRRLQYLFGALEDCTLRTGTERVIGYLLNRVAPDAHNGNAIVTLPTKKGIIASQLNLTHEHFSRILHGLVMSGMIEVDGRDVRLPDLGRLHARLNGAG